MFKNYTNDTLYDIVFITQEIEKILPQAVEYDDSLKVKTVYYYQAPKAYLCVLFFDERFKFDAQNSMVFPVGYSPNQRGTIDKTFANAIEVPKNGYAYIYITNETDELVYFDNLYLTHERGRQLEETHYYPFGLTMAGISSKTAGGLEANKRFQGQDFAHQEFSDGSGLEMYEFKYRMDDPQIGRFWQVDPLSDKYVDNSVFAFSENKVTSHVELEGLESKSINVPGYADARELERVTVSNNPLQNYALHNVNQVSPELSAAVEASMNKPSSVISQGPSSKLSLQEGAEILSQTTGNSNILMDITLSMISILVSKHCLFLVPKQILQIFQEIG